MNLTDGNFHFCIRKGNSPKKYNPKEATSRIGEGLAGRIFRKWSLNFRKSYTPTGV